LLFVPGLSDDDDDDDDDEAGELAAGLELIDGSLTRHHNLCSSGEPSTPVKHRHKTHKIVSYSAALYFADNEQRPRTENIFIKCSCK